MTHERCLTGPVTSPRSSVGPHPNLSTADLPLLSLSLSSISLINHSLAFILIIPVILSQSLRYFSFSLLTG